MTPELVQLLKNPGFGAGGANWILPPGFKVVGPPAYQPHTGSRLLVAGSGWVPHQLSNYAEAMQLIPTTPGARFKVSAYCRGRATTGRAQLHLAWHDKNKRYISEVVAPRTVTGKTGWIKLEVTGTAPPGAAYVTPHLFVGGLPYHHGDYDFDDVSLIRLPVAPPAPPVAPLVAPEARVKALRAERERIRAEVSARERELALLQRGLPVKPRRRRVVARVPFTVERRTKVIVPAGTILKTERQTVIAPRKMGLTVPAGTVITTPSPALVREIEALIREIAQLRARLASLRRQIYELRAKSWGWR